MRVMPRWAAFALIPLVAAASAASANGPADEPESFFELKVRPVLAGSCLKCHGAVKASGGLRLDSREAMLRGGESGPAVLPGEPNNSLLIHAVQHTDKSLEMPPGKLLPKEVRDDLAAWVAGGAKWPKLAATSRTIEGRKHWAFEPLDHVSPPVDPTGWATGPIDRFIAAGQRRHGLKPVRLAGKMTLIRRATFDLIGLPPAPERIEAFVADERSDAYERLVDELLASPQYGERWGRYWLDLARYADTAGDNSDYPVPQAHLYRDYVIDAFNADVPYDRFLHEQLAGDILAGVGPPEDYARRVIATGFVAQAKRFGTSKLEDIHQIIEDTLNTTGQVVLGLSLRCARCHDHKYDPISSRDYYALYGFFASTKYPFAGAEEERRPSEFVPLLVPEQVKSLESKHEAEINRLKDELHRAETESAIALQVRAVSKQISELEERQKAAQPAPATGTCDSADSTAQQLVELKASLEAAKKKLATQITPLKNQLRNREKESPVPANLLAYAVREGRPTDVRIQKGGNPHDLGELVTRGVPKCLDERSSLAIPKDASGRLELARWLTSGPASALTARVMVNRVWQHHFGKLIVPTPSDFGLRGTPPTHRELLDWLAREFIASGWSLKAMHKKIMLSKTYQLSTSVDTANAETDTGNAWYWRFERHAVDAEALRDALLDLGDSLDSTRPGPHPFPAVSAWRFTAHNQFKAVYTSQHRSVYLMVQRLHPHPYLSIFNGPDTSMTTAVRDGSSVPLQALFLLNSPFVHDQSTRFARTLLEQQPDPRARARLAYMRVYGRPPSAPELDRSLEYLRRYEQALTAEGLAADRREVESWSSLTRALLASNEFIYLD
jgi:Protein of unknown function (DUF1553)/Protein of unknown function (DUF1549)/Planctomycete cytochrome C